MSWVPDMEAVSLWRGEDCLAHRLHVARSFALRARGLMARRQIPASWGCGLLFPNCRSLHSAFMCFALDMVYVDGDGTVLHALPAVPPWRICPAPRGTRHALEWRAGAGTLPTPGDRLRLAPAC